MSSVPRYMTSDPSVGFVPNDVPDVYDPALVTPPIVKLWISDAPPFAISLSQFKTNMYSVLSCIPEASYVEIG